MDLEELLYMDIDRICHIEDKVQLSVFLNRVIDHRVI
jgi:hypothetical protein